MRFSAATALASIFLISACGDGPPQAQSSPAPTRPETGAHLHGYGELALARTGNEITVSLLAPGANYVTPEGEAPDEAGLTTIVGTADGIVSFGGRGGCELTDSGIEISTYGHDDDKEAEGDMATDDVEPDHDHGDEAKPDDHDHGDGHDHGDVAKPDDHDHGDGHDHGDEAKPDDHDHGDEGDDHSGHSDITATQTFTCATPDRIRRVETTVFFTFGGFESVGVTILKDDGDEFGMLTADNPDMAATF